MTEDPSADSSGAVSDSAGAAADLTDEEARQVAAVLDVCLERGFDVDGVDLAVLERARDRLRDRS